MTLNKAQLMIYGAAGYSAKLIIEELLSRNIYPILAGRNESSLKIVAKKYKCDFVVFSLNDEAIVDEALKDVHTLLNCAGPFKYTAKDMMEACLRTKTNYLDITGEMPVMHLAFSLSERAKEAGIVIMPSVGFDIIPTDCLAKRLSERMPDAVYLKLGLINNRGKISRGTLLTTLDFLEEKGLVRRNGKIVESPIGEFTVNVNLKNFSFRGLSIPWGDVYSSFHSTAIPNAEVYLALPKIGIKLKSLFLLALRILKVKFIKNIVAGYIRKNITGPSKTERENAKTFIWGRAENAKGEMVEEVYQIMEGYNLTAKGGAECAERVLKNSLQPGTYTPSLAFGSGFLELFVISKIY